jgi:hypothetical protein
MTSETMTDIIIDPDFRKYIPALSGEELAQLEANIVEDGCRDPLTLWGRVIIDGHNRFDICTRLGIPFQTVQKQFPTREAALDWMDCHQLGRRNLSPDARKLLLGRRYNRLKGEHGGDRSSGQNVHLEPERTAERLASDHGVNEKTVRRAGDFAKEVEADPELQAAIETGKPIAAVKRERAQVELSPAPPPEIVVSLDPERRKLAKLTTEALIDEVIGLRADLNDQKARAARYKSERDDMAVKLAEALVGDQGKTISNLQSQLRAAKFARDEAMAATKRMENRLKKAEARTKELENMEVSFG